jgi:hypothetical protein
MDYITVIILDNLTWYLFHRRPPNVINNQRPANRRHICVSQQLDSASMLFYVDFGDTGIGNGFLSNNGLVEKYLWQGV